ncbi:F-box protein, partial [Diplonema papillatum]
VRPLEVIVKPGELMYIPAGWWHLCLNLTPTVCITQNYVSRAGLPRVLSFLRDSPQCISGVCQEDRPSFYERFRSKLQEQLPAVLAEAEQKEKSDTESQTPWAKAMEDSTQDGFTFDW